MDNEPIFNRYGQTTQQFADVDDVRYLYLSQKLKGSGGIASKACRRNRCLKLAHMDVYKALNSSDYSCGRLP